MAPKQVREDQPDPCSFITTVSPTKAPAKSSKALREPGWERLREKETKQWLKRKEHQPLEGMELLRRSLAASDRASYFAGRVTGPGKHPMPHTHYVPGHF